MKPSKTIWSACFSARARSSGLRTVQVITGRLPSSLHRNGRGAGQVLHLPRQELRLRLVEVQQVRQPVLQLGG